jgi:hypothetical protein
MASWEWNQIGSVSKMLLRTSVDSSQAVCPGACNGVILENVATLF